MPNRRLLVVLAALIALSVPASASATTSAQLTTALSRNAVGLGPDSSLLVTNLTTGGELFSLRADNTLIPASNQKLFTTTSALLRYGPEARLQTTLRTLDGVVLDPATGILPGDIYLVGGGDPTFNDAALGRLAAALQKLGVKQIQGGVRADDSFLDRRRGSFDSNWKVDSDLSGQLSALSFNHGRSGSTTKAGVRLDKLLRGMGIGVATAARPGNLLGDGRVLATVNSPSIGRLAEMINVPSENFFAELLLKDLGANFGIAGSTPGGIAVMRSALSNSIGIAPRMVDGSGLSRQDKTTTRQLVKLLAAVRKMPSIAEPFANSLPKFGREGTVRKRLRRSAAADRCIAKTGTLIGVSSLSGYCTTPGGVPVAFSMISNRVNAGAVKKVEDKLIKAIAAYTG
jgi:D-alanyl-D-alanine carboxypeptidase/D-alanyl-D-alanine-endopeptidase (penicillin-binding protein 4)